LGHGGLVAGVSVDPRRKHLLSVIDAQQSQEASLGVGDDDGVHVAAPHALYEVLEGVVGACRGEAFLHDLLDAALIGCVERGVPQTTEDDPLVVHDDAGVPSGVPSAPGSVRDMFIGRARRHVTPGYCSGARRGSLVALGRESGGEPVCFARLVAVHAGETQSFEPPRGSCAHVSEAVVAIGNDRPGCIKLLGGGCVELLERQVDCALDVLCVVFVGGKDVDELGGLFVSEPTYLRAIDGVRHGSSSGCSVLVGKHPCRNLTCEFDSVVE
jgi:hypothetical protein